MAKSAAEVFRDFVRFTGDGLPYEPTGAPLPTGDPSSGLHLPSKFDIREWAKAIEALSGNPAALESLVSRVKPLTATAGNGSAYTVTGPEGSDSEGALVLFTPHVTNTVSNPTLAVNGGGARAIRGVGMGTNPTPIGRLAAGVPVLVRREGSFWRIVSDWDGLNAPNFGILSGVAGTPAAYTASLNAPIIDQGTYLVWSPHLDNAENPTLSVNGAAPKVVVCEDGISPMAGQLRRNGHYLLKVQPGGYYIIGMSRPAQPEELRVTREAQAAALMRTMAASPLEAGGAEDIGIRVIGGSNHSYWVASRGDREEIILVDGGTRWIDLSHLRPGCAEPITIRCISAARLYTRAQNYAVTPGTLVRVYRSTTADYVFEAIGGTVTASADALPPASLCFITAGQSLASNFLTAGLHGFQRGLLEYSGQARSVFAIDGATGSTGLLPESAGNPGHWWNDGPGTPGPAALAWKAALDAKPANQPAPAFIYWCLGQNDVGFMGNGITLARYVSAYQALFAWMRAQLGSAVPIIWSPLGSWDVDGAPSDAQASAVRWAEHSVRAAVAGVHVGPHTFDLPRAFYDVHPTEAGQVIQGYRLAAHVAALLYGATPNNGPAVSALAEVDGGQSYRIDFTPGDPGDPLWRPAWADGLAFYRAGQDPLSGDAIVQTRHVWENNTRLRVYLAEAAPGATLLWPAGTMMEALAGRYVRNTGNSPLRVGIGNHVPLKPVRTAPF